MKAQKKAVLRNLVTSLVLYEKVKTTRARAKAAKVLVEKMILLGQRKDPPTVRKLYQFFLDKNAAKKIKEDLVERFGKRKSGFVRTARIGFRAGDAAEMVQMELILPRKIEKEKKLSALPAGRQEAKSRLPKKYEKGKIGEKEKVKTKIRVKPKTEKIEKPQKIKQPKKVVPVEKKKKSWFESATKKVWRKRTTQK